jgi:tRNA1(Val) A37 N6-methylase TrmN6
MLYFRPKYALNHTPPKLLLKGLIVRLAARLKLGYYPLPEGQAPMLRARLAFPQQKTSALDPCCGKGTAILGLTEGSQTEVYGVELDADRAAIAKSVGINTIHGNVFDVRARVERLSMLYLNPPYDFEVGPLANQRMERLFLAHTFHWLKPKGVLLMVIPVKAVYDTMETLTTRFKDIQIYRMAGEESEKYDQCAVFAVRHNNNGNDQLRFRQQVTRTLSYSGDMPLLTPHPDRMYNVPPTDEVEINYVGLPLDEIEDRLMASNAWKAAVPLLLPKQEVAGGRPITPLHGGHVGLLATAGMLNGVFGQGEKRHLARWRPVKHTTTTTEVEDDIEITRTKERFSNELAVVFCSGQTLVLTETKPPEPVKDEPKVDTPDGSNTVMEDAVVFSRLNDPDSPQLFQLGRLAMTQAVQELVSTKGLNPYAHLAAHKRGDWGDISEGERKDNDFALEHGDLRLFSVYESPQCPDGKLWIITEADRSSTTILLPSDN